MEIQRVFFSGSGILTCALENCQDAFGHLPGEEDVENFFQFSQDVLLQAGKTRAGKQKGLLLPDELTSSFFGFGKPAFY